jgi:hypothetical protein
LHDEDERQKEMKQEVTKAEVIKHGFRPGQILESAV